LSCQSPCYHMIRVKTCHVIDIKSFSKRLKTCCLRIMFKHFVLSIYKGNGSIQILNSSFKQYNTNKKSKSLENNVINRKWDQVLRKISTPACLLAMTFKVLILLRSSVRMRNIHISILSICWQLNSDTWYMVPSKQLFKSSLLFLLEM
jgi:hypothetical protein